MQQIEIDEIGKVVRKLQSAIDTQAMTTEAYGTLIECVSNLRWLCEKSQENRRDELGRWFIARFR